MASKPKSFEKKVVPLTMSPELFIYYAMIGIWQRLDTLTSLSIVSNGVAGIPCLHIYQLPIQYKINMSAKSLFHPPQTIVLVGMMGAGKTSIGRRLSTKLGVSFVDSDAEIENAAGSTIADIFELHGEEFFRNRERRIITRLLNKPIKVLATGGGAFIDNRTRELILDRSISVWIRASVDILTKRLEKNTSTRPLLNKTGNIRQILEKLIDERHPLYEKANILVDSSDGKHEPIVDSIYDALQVFVNNLNNKKKIDK